MAAALLASTRAPQTLNPVSTLAGCLQQQPAGGVQPPVRPPIAADAAPTAARSGAAAGAAASSVSGEHFSLGWRALVPGSRSSDRLKLLGPAESCEQERMTVYETPRNSDCCRVPAHHCYACCSAPRERCSLVLMVARALVARLVSIALQQHPKASACRCAERDPRGGARDGGGCSTTPVRLHRRVRQRS